MKYLFSILMILFLAFPVMAEEVVEDNSDNSDNSVQYMVDMGNGTLLLITGDNNTITLPVTDPVEVVPNQITFSDGKIFMVLTNTNLDVGGVVTEYEKLVFVLEEDKWELIWYEQ